MSDTKDISEQDKQELANFRTEWAEDRTALANERTFAAWMRTGMACLGVALGLKAVFGPTDHTIMAKSAAELFVICAVLIFWTAAKRSRSTQKRISNHDITSQSHRTMTITAAIMTTGAVSTGIILWLL